MSDSVHAAVDVAAIGAEVRSYICDYFLLGSSADFQDDTSLIDVGILDSTGATELVTFLEARYGIAVADEDLIPDNLDSIARIAVYVGRKLDATNGYAAKRSVGDATVSL